MKNLSYSTFLLLGLTLFLISCSKESSLEPSDPIESLKEWYQVNAKLNLEENILWEKAKEHYLPDSSLAYEIPIYKKKGVTELFVFQNGEKRDAVYKEFNVNSSGLELKVYSLDGRLLKNGILSKKTTTIGKGKKFTMREMNSEAPLVDNGFRDEVIFIGVRLYPIDWGATGFGGWGDYNSAVFTFMDSINLISGGGGGSSGEPTDLNFKDYNYSEISSELTNECLIAVLNEMQSKNIYGEIAGILSLFKETKVIPIFNFRIKEMTFKEQFEGDTKDYYGQQKNGVISLNTHLLANASKEFIAKVIMHEMLHKFILEDPIIKEYDHSVMLDKFVKPMSFFINQLYGLAERDAFLISLAGLSFSPHYKKILNNDSSLSESIIRQAEYNYTTQKNYGTHCN
jgi:hypothetical protein